MIRNLFPNDELDALARLRRRRDTFVTVKPQEVAEYEAKGWQVARKNKNSVRLSQPKAKSEWFEDRVWAMLHRMGFTYMSGKGGARLSVTPNDATGPTNQLDVVAVDNEAALWVECKTAEQPKRRPQLQHEIEHLSSSRDRFAAAVQRTLPADVKRTSAQVMFLWDVIPGERERAAAESEGVVIMNLEDLEYYEALVAHLGSAARYLFLSELLAGRQIRGLEARVPAIRAKMGKLTYYMFVASPEYLLKITSVAHRAGRQRADLGAYQRMVDKTRLKKIAKYISEYGIFPTNIVLNLQGPKAVQFELSELPQQEGSRDGPTYGTLCLRPSYGGAWVIDGQHRLYAYSGHERAARSYLNVIAFVDLPVQKQAQLFIDINHEQKSVKRSLLQELFATLKWSDVDEAEQVRAIISRAIASLGQEEDSVFRGRILLTSQRKTDLRCITISSVFAALYKPGLYIVEPGVEYGPLWAGDREKTVQRTAAIVGAWFGVICSHVRDWWNVGAGEGGGLAMSDGVAMCISLMRGVLKHLESSGLRLTLLTTAEVIEQIRPYGDVVGQFFGRLSAAERREFRDSLRGIQGQTARRRECEEELHGHFPEFNPPGLAEYLELREAKTTTQAYELIHRIELLLKENVVSSLTTAYGATAWWYEGVPEDVRTKASTRLEQEKGKGQRQDHLDLLDYRAIARANWDVFRPILEFDGRGKEKGTAWIAKLNEVRKAVMHPSKSLPVTWEQLDELKRYEHHLSTGG